MSVMDEDSSFIKWCCCKMYYTLTMESEEGKKKVVYGLVLHLF